MTPVCVSVADVARELASIRRLVARGLGRDVLSRTLAGGWQLLLMAAVATVLGVGLGAAWG